MKSIEVRFRVEGAVAVTDQIRHLMQQRYPSVSQAKVAKLWEGAIPPREKLSIEVAGGCASIMDDWECRIFGSNFEQCLAGLISLHETLRDTLGVDVGFQLMSPGDGRGSLEMELRRQQRQAFLSKIAWMLTGAIAGAAIGAVITLAV